MQWISKVGVIEGNSLTSCRNSQSYIFMKNIKTRHSKS